MQEFALPTLRGRIAIAVLWLCFFAWAIVTKEFLGPIAHDATKLCYCDSLPYVRGEIIFFSCLALAIAGPSYWLSFQLFKFQQIPLPGAYVFFRTRIRRGWEARIAAIGWLALAVGITGGYIYAWFQLNVYQLLNYEIYSGCP